MNVLKYLVIHIRKRLTQIISVSIAIAQNKITFCPPYLVSFEKQFADFCSTDYALSFCNGTSAIEASLFAIGVQPGDEVIVPSCTFHSSIDPICNLGAEPVFADVDDRNFTISPEDVQRKITTRTKAIIVVHVFGIPAAMRELIRIAHASGIAVIEDVSHGHGAMADGRMCGSLGRIGAFSLQGAKAIAAGEGGMTVTRKRADYLRMSLWGHFNRHGAQFSEINGEEFEATGLGYKRRMAPLGALLAKADLAEIHRVNRIMNGTASKLDDALATIPGVLTPRLPEGSRKGGFYCGYAFSVGTSAVRADAVIRRLRSIGIDAQGYPFARHHTLAIYRDPGLRNRVRRNVGPGPAGRPTASAPLVLRNTEQLESSLVLIPRRYLVLLSNSRIRKLAAALEDELSSAPTASA